MALASLGLFSSTTLSFTSSAQAKTPGKTYCFYGHCHRVMTLAETRRAVGKMIVVRASHYDDPKKDRYNPSNVTSSGEWFRAGAPDNAASPKLPNGTIILAWNPATKQSVVLRINNAGPYWGGRQLDVSRGAAERLGFARQGVATLHTQIVHVPSVEEATYKKGRNYAAVPGYLGTFGSLELALAETGRRMNAPDIIPASTIAVASAEPVPADVSETATAPAPAATAVAVADVATAGALTPAYESSIVNGVVLMASAAPELNAEVPDLSPIFKPEPAAPAAAPGPQIRTASLNRLPPTGRSNSRSATVVPRFAQLRSLNTADPYAQSHSARRSRSAKTAASKAASTAPVRFARNTATTSRMAQARARVSDIDYDDDDYDRPQRVVRRYSYNYVPSECRGSSRACDAEAFVSSPRPIRSSASSSSKRR